MYLYSAAADIVHQTGDTEISKALEMLWRNVTEKRLYVTGGVGPSGHNEGFTNDYELPNVSAYAETCASIGLIFWAHRMFLLHGESRFVDVLETALYNGALSEFRWMALTSSIRIRWRVMATDPARMVWLRVLPTKYRTTPCIYRNSTSTLNRTKVYG